MFKLEFDPENKPLAVTIGRALLEYGNGAAVPANAPVNAVQAIVSPSSDKGTRPAATEREKLTAGSIVLPADFQGYKVAATASTEPTLDEAATTNPALDVNEAAVADLGNAQSTAEQGAGGAQGATGAKLDLHGVPFDADYCANAVDPYYKTGKNAGQWKKKKGVDQDEYDDWYASVKPAAGASTSATAEDAPIDTTAAFSGQPQQAPANTGAPADAGAFMVWVSEMTTAGHFTQADVTAAYGVVGIGAADIFQGANAVQNIASLHGVLSAKVQA